MGLAQQTMVSPLVLRESRDPVAIARQLRMAVSRGRSALDGLQAAVPDNSVPHDESVIQAAKDTYVLIRAARAGLRTAKDAKRFRDPILEYSFLKIEDAWNLARTPVDLSHSSMPRQEYLRLAIADLSKAVRIVEQVLALMP
jgi:hypothetical protein